MSAQLEMYAPGEDSQIAQALEVLERRFALRERSYSNISGSADLRAWASLKLAELEREVFVVAFLDPLHRIFAVEQLHAGTLNQTTVYAREVARAALRCNAAAVVLVHNHPSGCAQFSEEDKRLTEQLREALQLIDVTVLDHVLVAGARSVTYAEVRLLEKTHAKRERQRSVEAQRARQSQSMKAAWARRKKSTGAQK